MKTRKFFTVCIALLIGSQVALFAQETKKPERKRPTQEQMLQMQCNHIIKALALDDATAAKFAPVYKKYMEALRSVRKMGQPEKAQKKAGGDNVEKDKNLKNRPVPKPLPTDAEVEAAIKARFAQSRKMLDIREQYYNEFRKFLSPKQIQKMYNMEKNNGDKFRKEMNKRQGMKKHNGNKRTKNGTKTMGMKQNQ